MNNKFRRLMALLLCAAMLLSLPVLSGCSATGDTLLSLGKTEITETEFIFWLSRYKAQFLYAYGDSLRSISGASNADEFWKMKSDSSADALTYDQMFTEYVFENAKTYLISLYLFDEYGLSLSDETKKAITETIDSMREDLAGGSKNEFNVILADYGFNTDTLRACYEINEKVSVLQNYVFSSNGPCAMTEDMLDEYYRRTYERMDQICIFLDQCPDKTEDGEYKIDDKGNISYRDMSAAEETLARENADKAMAELAAGTDFAAVRAKYNENTESDIYTNGIYLSSDNVYTSGDDAATLYETLGQMKEGEVKLVELSHTLHIIKKLPLEAGAYKNAVNADFFSFYDASLMDYVSFAEFAKTPLYLEFIEKKLAEHAAEIRVNEDVRARCSIAAVKENYEF